MNLPLVVDNASDSVATYIRYIQNNVEFLGLSWPDLLTIDVQYIGKGRTKNAILLHLRLVI